jgi:hypothetical protein
LDVSEVAMVGADLAQADCSDVLVDDDEAGGHSLFEWL